MAITNIHPNFKAVVDLLPHAILCKTDNDFLCCNDVVYSWSNYFPLEKNNQLKIEFLIDLFSSTDEEKSNLNRFINTTTESKKTTTLVTTLSTGQSLRWKWLSTGQYLMIEEVTDWQDQLLELKTLSDTDPLTNLANRRRFQRDFTRLIAQGSRNQQVGALILFDIDDLKMINDQWGHAVGDKILSEFGRLAKSCVRPYESLSRIGGDEFAIVTQHAGLQGAERLIRSIESVFNQIKLPNDQPVSASFGLSLFNQANQDIAKHLISSQIHQDHIYAMADAELYKSKMLKKKQNQLY